METDKFKKAKELSEQIEQWKFRIFHIETLIDSCDIYCEIDGVPKNRCNRLNKYHSSNTEFIKKLLENDKLLLETKLNDLQKQFNEL